MKKIVLSTDIGTDGDDALALDICMNHSEIEIKGIYVTNGIVETRAKLAKSIVDKAKFKTQVATGSEYPLSGHPNPFVLEYEEYAIPKKYKDKSLEELSIRRNGVESLAEKVSEGNIIIASIAPLTTIAEALEKYPNQLKKVKEVYIMGGREGEYEHNFKFDPEAIKIILKSHLPIIIVPADICDKLRLRKDKLGKLISSYGKMVYDSIRPKLAHDTTFNYNEALVSKQMDNNSIECYINLMLQSNRFPFHISESFRMLTDNKIAMKKPDEYFLNMAVLKHMIETTPEIKFRKDILDFLNNHQIEKISVHDVYTIYSIIHPEKTKIEHCKIEVDNEGRMTKNKGSKHKIITNLDYEHFEKFIDQYLY